MSAWFPSSTTRDDKSQSASSSASLPAWAFLIAAITLFLLLAIVHSLWVITATYGLSAPTQQGLGWNWIWALFALGFLAWGGLNQFWGHRALKQGRLTPTYVHHGVSLCCGLAAIGVQLLALATTATDESLIYDFSNRDLGIPRPTLSAAPAALSGNPADGGKLFSAACVTCHGPTGDGLNNLAPSLRSSEFIKNASAVEIAKVIRSGRAVGDAANKTGKIMPAKGGNPFLTEQQIAHLAAFVKRLPDAAPSAVSSGSSGWASTELDAPTVQLAKWVVPPAARPPQGLRPLTPDEVLIGSEGFERLAKSRRTWALKTLGVATILTHGLFLIALFLATAETTFSWLLEVRAAQATGWLRVLNWGWMLALVVWIAFGLLFRLL